MKVTHFDTENRVVFLQLTRRNLEILLQKLDRPDSARTIQKRDEAGAVSVTAVENAEHYSDRPAGLMREDFDPPVSNVRLPDPPHDHSGFAEPLRSHLDRLELRAAWEAMEEGNDAQG